MSEIKDLVEAIIQGDQDRVSVILDTNPDLVNQYDDTGATPLHYAALNGRRAIVQLLIERGADINSPDSQFGATPTGWAIEYLREMGGFLTIELTDLAFAIETKDIKWVGRFLRRFPLLRDAKDTKGRSFRQLAKDSGDPEIIKLFE